MSSAESLLSRNAESTEEKADDELTAMMKRVDLHALNMVHPATEVYAEAVREGGIMHPSEVDTMQEQPQIAEKLRYANILTGKDSAPSIKAELKDSDIAILKKKAYLRTLVDFDRWITRDYLPQGLDSQVIKNWLHEVYPEWFERQAEQIAKMNDVKKTYEIMRIEGPKTIEDLYFMYQFNKAAETHLGSNLAIITTNNCNIPFTSDAYGNEQFDRGIFNMRRRLYEWLNVQTAMGHSIIGNNPYDNSKEEVDRGERNRNVMKHYATFRRENVITDNRNMFGFSLK